METKLKIIALLAFFTEIAPEQRIGQIIDNAKKYSLSLKIRTMDMYYMEDEDFLKMLEEYKTYYQENLEIK